MLRRPWLITLLLAGCAQISTQPPATSVAAPVEPANLRAHIEYLAADELRGRDTGSAGYEQAAEYVAAEFEKLGLSPVGDDDGFFQQVPLVEARLVKDSARARIASTSAATELKYPDQFTMSPSKHEAYQQVSGELVFVGHGIVAPEFDHDDYAGLDVEGKIVVMLVGRPTGWPTEEGAL